LDTGLVVAGPIHSAEHGRTAMLRLTLERCRSDVRTITQPSVRSIDLTLDPNVRILS
jgi:hypothetical protein